MALDSTFAQLRDSFYAGLRHHFVNLIIVAIGISDWFFFVHATRSGNFYEAQAAVLAGVALVFAGVARLTQTFSLAPSEDGMEEEKNRSKWLTRLALVAALGMAAIILYAIQYQFWPPAQVASTLSVGFITAGATWLTGALTGFLFGIPHMREGDREPKTQLSAGNESAVDETQHQDIRYQPSTSLEQISDWLTKIIVGLALVDIAKIPGK